MKLTDKKYWDSVYEAKTFVESDADGIVILLNKFVKNGEGKEAIEIGSFPGTFLPAIGRKGYVLNGIDYNSKNADDLPQWLDKLHLKVGDFQSGDFFEFIKFNSKKYDLVCSYGFIEHFENFEDIIRTHMDLVKPGGQLIITTPNFRGWMQFIPHLLFDRTNLKRHYLPSMNPGKWRKFLENNQFKVQFSGYFGGYRFWVDPNEKRSKLNYNLLRFAEKSISQFGKLFKVLKIESSAYSSFCGIVATKIDN